MSLNRSPFPGMDPWLESYWGDVHTSLATYTRDQLNRRLVSGLVARAQERVYIESPLYERRGFSPDIHVFEEPRRTALPASGATAIVASEPDLLHIGAIEVTERFIEIRDARSGGEVVTVIEFVSSTIKRTRMGRRKYLQKQREVLTSASTNLVEVDLLRSGRPITLASPEFVPVSRRAPYHVAVHRAGAGDTLEYYGIRLQERLPVIKVPLRANDQDVLLELQAVIDEAYQNGSYAGTIDYTQPPVPALKNEDAAWAESLLKQRNS